VSTATAPAETGTSAAESRSWAERLRGRNNEGVLGLTILVLVLVMSLVNGDFFTVSTLFSILRNSLVEMVFASAFSS
jgi:simple sugar transport system permease protein